MPIILGYQQRYDLYWFEDSSIYSFCFTMLHHIETATIDDSGAIYVVVGNYSSSTIKDALNLSLLISVIVSVTLYHVSLVISNHHPCWAHTHSKKQGM